MLAYDAVSKKLISAKKLAFADKIVSMSKTKNVWEVIGEMVKYWESTNPRQFNSMIIDVTDKRNTRARKTGGSSNDSTRYLADIPIQLYGMMKIFYPEVMQEKGFFREFAKRFPQYRVAEKL